MSHLKDTVWITSNEDEAEHAVTADAFDAGIQRTGEFEALCGDEFLCAPMTVGPIRRCARCVRFLNARRSMTELPDRLEHRSLLSRLLSRHQPPVDAEASSDSPASTGLHPRRHGRHAA